MDQEEAGDREGATLQARGRVRASSGQSRTAPQPLKRRLRRAAKMALTEMAGWRLAGGLAEHAIDRFSHPPPPAFPLAELFRVIGALEAARIPFWLGGGWGVDALWGGQSRFHHDLDLVLGDFERAIGPLSEVLARLGYCPREPRQVDLWWLPLAADFESPEGNRVEVLGLNWRLLAATAALAGSEQGEEATHSALRASCLVEGRLAGRPVPCLSIAAQALFHTGYHRREDRERAFLAAIGKPPGCEASATARSALVIPAFDVDTRTQRLWSELHPTTTLPPYVTLLIPFLPASLITLETSARLAEIVASVSRFAFELAEVRWSGAGSFSLAPESSQPLAALIHTLAGEFGVPPMGDADERIALHLSLGDGRPIHQLRHAAVRVQRCLPLWCLATEVWLLWEQGPGSWEVSARFPLGGQR